MSFEFDTIILIISKNFDSKRKNNVINSKFILYNENKSYQIENFSHSNFEFWSIVEFFFNMFKTSN